MSSRHRVAIAWCSVVLPCLAAVVAVGCGSKPSASVVSASSSPGVAPAAAPTPHAPAGVAVGEPSPLSKIRRAPIHPAPTLLAAGQLPLAYIPNLSGSVRILNATTGKVLVNKAGISPNGIISVSATAGVRVGQITYTRGPLEPDDRYEVWWDVDPSPSSVGTPIVGEK